MIRLYDLSDKISYIVTDNASNMKAAFAVSFPTSEQDAEVLEPPENEDLWNECTDTSVTRIETTRVSCFAHTLQLTVGDGLKESKAISGALSRAVSVSSTIHKSTSYKVSNSLCYLR